MHKVADYCLIGTKVGRREERVGHGIEIDKAR
jgi:hypothetical protein